MSYTQSFSQSAQTPEGVLTDSGVSTTGDTTLAVSTTVSANGGGANAVAIAFTAAGLQSLLMLATVPCVVTLTGATVINGVTIGTVTLAANVITRVAPDIGTFTGNVTAVSVGASSGAVAGTIEIRALFNS